jgi:hypothetical protein
MRAGGAIFKMATPLHLTAFQHFYNATKSHLEALVAYGLFTESETQWAQTKQSGPSRAQLDYYHQFGTSPYESAKFLSSAQKLLLDFANQIAETKRAQFLQEALREYEVEAGKGHSAFRGWGCVEGIIGAFIGALLWSVFLIGATIIASRNGIDIVEVYQRLSGHH